MATARIDTLYQSFNVGVFDRNKLHRVDLDRIRLAAEMQTNFMCTAAGNMFLRPGTEYLGTAPSAFRPLPFAATSDQAFVLELSDTAMRVFDQQRDELVQRPDVSTVVTNGDFGSSTGWTLASTGGQSSSIGSNKLTLQARAHGAKASAVRSVTVASPDQGILHALRVVVERGPVTFRCGSTSGGDDYVADTELRTGEHSLAFTPTGDFYVYFESIRPVAKIVDSIQVEAAGIMELPTIWPIEDAPLVRVAQSLDVLFCAARGYRRQRIERRNDDSWSVCDYDADDGPFLVGRTADVTLTPAATEGNTTLTASSKFFKTGHVGALFRLDHVGQKVETWVAAGGAFTDAFLVTGITETDFEERKHTVAITGTWSGTLKNMRSFDGELGDYHEYRREQTSDVIAITSNATYTNDDNDDNAEIWIKMGFRAGDYTSGEAAIAFDYPNGGGYGIARVIGYVSETVVNVEVLRPFKQKTATSDWREGRYSDLRGQPSAVSIADGRLDWLGDDIFDASISDAYESFDEEFVGDAGPISRAIALGGRNQVQWALPLSSLVIGCDGRIANARASTLDELITPDNFGMKSLAKIAAAPLSPVELADDRGLFVHGSRTSLYEIPWDSNRSRYVVSPFSKLTTDLFRTGIRSIDVASLPDQRIWVANENADAVCIVFEPGEQVLAAHVPISTGIDSDVFLDFCVLPGAEQDRVYAAVKRVVNGQTVYLLERFALDSETEVDDVVKVMDAHITFGASGTVISGLDHIEGRNVVAWVDGAPVNQQASTETRIFTVLHGQIQLPNAPTVGGCVGLQYTGRYKSARLAYGVNGYSPMKKNKGLAGIGLLLADFCRSGIKYGSVAGAGFLANLSLPALLNGKTAPEVVAGPGADEDMVFTGSQLSLDLRVCLEVASPKPASFLALVLGIQAQSD